MIQSEEVQSTESDTSCERKRTRYLESDQLGEVTLKEDSHWAKDLSDLTIEQTNDGNDPFISTPTKKRKYNGSTPQLEEETPASRCYNAPQNSTQFIMDNHEDSSLFWNFDYKERHGEYSPGSSSSVMGQEAFEAQQEEFNIMWAEYDKNETQTEENAKHDMFQKWSKTTLMRKILRLQKVANILEHKLALKNPKAYVDILQGQLLQLQKENRRLKQAAKDGRNR